MFQSNGTSGPLKDVTYMQEHYCDSATVTPRGGGEVFLMADDTADLFHLAPGQYIAVLFTDEPDTHLSYIFTVGYLRDANVTVRGYNTYNDAMLLAK